MDINESLLAIKKYTDEGYSPVVDYDKWRVAVLNYCDELLPENITKLQRHDRSDEVFVLLKGSFVLFIGEGHERVDKIHGIKLEPLKLYNVRSGVWHSHTLTKDTTVLIVENSDTGAENSPEIELGPEQRAGIVELAKKTHIKAEGAYMVRSDYYLDDDDRYVIENYTDKNTFSGFLPGIAGLKGIPMWAFYVNRGQAVCSFGIRDKDKPIMEFFPAYRSYQNVEYTGFRTFIRLCGGEGGKLYEPFSSLNGGSGGRKLYIGANDIEIEDISTEYGLKTNVRYFILPGEEFAALVRTVSISNISAEDIKIEVLDGMPAIIPYGISDTGLKAMGNTLKAWMSVYNLENSMPFYKLRSSTADSAEVSEIQGGHFFLSFTAGDSGKILNPIVDPEAVFGSNTSFSCPGNFERHGLGELLQRVQATSNIIPSAFSGTEGHLTPGQALEFYSVIGYVHSFEHLDRVKERVTRAGYIEKKQAEAQELVNALTEDIFTKTSSRIFDQYCRISYLDNFIRGGYPLLLGKGKSSFVNYVYSRKHGDLERDYNYFVTEPEYYSTGNGNYRDVNQNRRSDVLFHPGIEDFNIKTFMNLIQADGYNPLVLYGNKFVLRRDADRSFMDNVREDGVKAMEKLLQEPFALGKLYRHIALFRPLLSPDEDGFADSVLSQCNQVMEAEHGEGYWTDHWTYNLDLIESYLSVYPDREKQLLFEDKEYTYYDSPALVQPRARKYILARGEVRQCNAVVICEEKAELLRQRKERQFVMRCRKDGAVYKSTLFAKLVVLAVNKFSCLDPAGMGIEMEAGKPGWNDALNGLPGLFGSSVAESYELARLLKYIIGATGRYPGNKLEMPVEAVQLMNRISGYIDDYLASGEENKDFVYWDKVATAREEYREQTRMGFDGENVEIGLEVLAQSFSRYLDKLDTAIRRALKENHNIYPTYFYYEAERYELMEEGEGRTTEDSKGNTYVKVKAFRQKKLPLFLEGVVRALKLRPEAQEVKRIYEAVKQSGLYDRTLKMYKNNESLEQELLQLGRIRAFTPGWFENETVWLHMEYKYMLELLRSGAYEQFFRDFQEVFVPFLEPAVYGRSILENSSFIASSANPDSRLHGRGFVARLSGATAEFLSIWCTMLMGHRPFRMEDGELMLELKPVLPGWLFDENNEVRFNFLSKTRVTYHNCSRRNTYEEAVTVKRTLLKQSGEDSIIIDGGIIAEPYSTYVREGKIDNIDIEL